MGVGDGRALDWWERADTDLTTVIEQSGDAGQERRFAGFAPRPLRGWAQFRRDPSNQ